MTNRDDGMALQALLFDVDGTLAETEEVHRQAFNEAFRAFGLDWVWDRALYGELLKVTGGRERMRHYAQSRELAIAADPEFPHLVGRIHQHKTRLYGEILAGGEVSLNPGVARLLGDAREAGLRLAIATTTTPENVEALLAPTLGTDAMGWFDAIGAGDCVPEKKPAPDIYDWVMRELALPPQSCIAFEDSANGVRSSRAAELPVLVTPGLYTRDDDFAGATAVISHLGEPGLPFDVLAGELPDGRYVDVDWLQRLVGR
ncbi:HAD family hydrolase [Methylonatrum kenyense]|uniref:HAD family hydrolase n=1 Tax=Methylonatrum kenyense TaxID=455253 RepID=UPI0020C02244|nr:HAD family hydrolase [Methylonatrum kenyense]MCK8516165.1 HAD family hydrolase [Methylonatrum kenyense]